MTLFFPGELERSLHLCFMPPQPATLRKCFPAMLNDTAMAQRPACIKILNPVHDYFMHIFIYIDAVYHMALRLNMIQLKTVCLLQIYNGYLYRSLRHLPCRKIEYWKKIIRSTVCAQHSALHRQPHTFFQCSNHKQPFCSLSMPHTICIGTHCFSIEIFANFENKRYLKIW